MKAPWSLVPMLFPLTAIAGGILLHSAGVTGLWILLPLGAMLLLIIARRRTAAVMAALLACGMTIAMLRAPGSLPGAFEGVAALYSGTIERIADHESNRTYELKIDSVNGRRIRPFMAAVTVPSFLITPSVTDRMTVNCALTAQPEPLTLPDEIDPRRMCCPAIGFAPIDSVKSCIKGRGVRAMLAAYRGKLSDKVYLSHMNAPTAEFVNAMLTGDTADIAPGVRDRFAASGLSHLLALSGLHVGLIAWMAGAILYPFFPSRHSRGRAFAMIATVWIFAAATGLTPSVTRAAVMATVVIAAGQLRRRHSPYNSLFLAATLILCATPYALFTPGFQLTFAAVAGILAVTTAVNKMPRPLHAWRELLLMAGVPMAAVVATAFPCAYYFHTFPVHFLGSNILAGWLVAPLLLCGTAATATGLKFPAECADALFSAIDTIADYFAGLPGNLQGFYPTATGALLGCTALALIALALHRRRRAYVIMTAMVAAAMILVEMADRRTADDTEVYFAGTRKWFNVVVRDGNCLIVSTTAPKRLWEEVRADAELRYSRYMGLRGIEKAEITDDFSVADAARSGQRLTVARRNFLIIGRDARPDTTCRSAIITSGFRGNPAGIIGGMEADTVYIAADVDPRLARRYGAQLRAQGVAAVVMLRDVKWVRRIQTSY